MFNTLDINSGYINNHKQLISESSKVASSSFDISLLTKYGFKSAEGIYFNFNNIELGNKYGNRMEDHNFDDIADSEIYKYGNALKNGGVIYDKRYKEKAFDITLIINSDTIENLETEIRNLKSALDIGGECYKNEKNNLLKINVTLEDIEVSRLKLTGTTVKIKLITVDPFWSSSSSVTKFNEGNSGSFTGSLAMTGTKVKGYVKHMLNLKKISGVINQLTLTIANFPLVINQVFAPNVSAGSLTTQIASNNDDGKTWDNIASWQNGSCVLSYNNSTWYSYCPGFRFQNITIPKGAKITSAILRLTSATNDSTSMSYAEIQGRAQDNMPAWDTMSPGYSAWGSNAGLKYWPNVPAMVIDGVYDTPDISNIVQAIVNRSGWVSGNAMGFAIYPGNSDATCSRTFYDYSSDPAKAAQLIVTYETVGDGTVVVLDGINNDVLVNGTKVKCLGQFPELDINKSYPLTVDFAGGGSVDDFDLYSIYDNKQL